MKLISRTLHRDLHSRQILFVMFVLPLVETWFSRFIISFTGFLKIRFQIKTKERKKKKMFHKCTHKTFPFRWTTIIECDDYNYIIFFFSTFFYRTKIGFSSGNFVRGEVNEGEFNLFWFFILLWLNFQSSRKK